MKHVFHPQARREFKREAHHYRQVSEERAKHFNKAVRQKIDLILRYPEAHTKVGRSTTRKAVILEYQFNIFYRFYPDRQEVKILEITRTSRRPGRWKDRT